VLNPDVISAHTRWDKC